MSVRVATASHLRPGAHPRSIFGGDFCSPANPASAHPVTAEGRLVNEIFTNKVED